MASTKSRSRLGARASTDASPRRCMATRTVSWIPNVKCVIVRERFVAVRSATASPRQSGWPDAAQTKCEVRSEKSQPANKVKNMKNVKTINVTVDLTYDAGKGEIQVYGTLVATYDPEQQQYIKYAITFNPDLPAFTPLADQLVKIHVMYNSLTSPIVTSQHGEWLKTPVTIENFEMPKHTYIVSVSVVQGTLVVNSDQFDL
ncbi:hypothetical protein [Verminephrobacter aporrectodeae]|uniref:hypothetical protein n=1 Tax=Verminephrobacter aporrectodeae TaxID=1110389 RepID=UPI002236FD82|nr:hypothetical protein [Verminephrobacter aporrectodeae]